MAGSLKVTCPHGTRAYAYTTTASIAALKGATSWTISFFYELGSWEAGFNGDLIQIGNPPFVAVTHNDNTVSFFARNAGNTATIGKSIAADTSGHHVLVSGSAAGTSTIYIDGIANANTASLGALLNANAQAFVGWDDPGHAATLYLRDLAIWASHAATPAEALELAQGTHTPATLSVPATNYWTLQGPAGAVAAGTQGLADSIGSVNLDGIFGSGVLTYDAHTITSNPAVPVLFMTPYVDTTGYLLFVPLYRNASISDGGPLPAYNAVMVGTNPVFTVAGSTVTPIALPHDVLCSFIAYQFATRVAAGQVVTMAAAPGWAFTDSGIVGGTSAAGLGSDPVTCLNYAGTARDAPPVTPTYKTAWNVVGSGDRGWVAQVMRNWARRINSLDPGNPSDNNWRGTGTITAFDANNLPAAFTGPAGAYLLGFLTTQSANNGADARGIPTAYGQWTLIYGDATPGVNATTHVLDISLTTLDPAWLVGSPTVVNAGDWDGTAWHHITRVYPVMWRTSGGNLASNILVRIARADNVAGPVVIPILPNGQSELGVFEPSLADPSVPAAVDYAAMFDPMAISPTWLAHNAGAHAIRWMSNQLLMTTTGSGDLVYPADLAVKTPSRFLASHTTTTYLDVVRVDPVPNPVNAIIDYIHGDSTGTLPVANTPTRSWTILAAFTTSAPHGLRTGDRFQVVPNLNVRAVVANSAYITLTAAITATQTVLPFSATTNLNGDPDSFIYPPTPLGTSPNDHGGYILQLGPQPTDEQVEVISYTGLNVTVYRAARGTKALAKPAGTVVYPCSDLNYGGGLSESAIVISPTQVLAMLFIRDVPRTAPITPTLLFPQIYSHGSCPVFNQSKPWFRGTATYELCSRATSLLAAANVDGACICWVSVPFFATDAAVMAVVNKMIPDFQATPRLRLIVQVDNELFNGQFDQHVLAVLFAPVAPNPQAPGTPFVDWYDYGASRQHRFNILARAVFTAAALDPNRVVWYHFGGGPNFAAQGTIAYCQTYNLPIESFAISFYADMFASNLSATYLSWLPASTGVVGARASWDLATSRAIMMSNYRASMRYGWIGAIGFNVAIGQYLSRYNHGLSVDGVAPAHTNAVRGQLCGYEGATTQILPLPIPGFPQAGAWCLAMQYDPEWYQTERAFYEANQDGAYQYALLMGSKFPDPADAKMDFGAYFSNLGQSFPIGPDTAYMYSTYRWQQQKAGYGDGSHGGEVNRLDFWTASAGVVTAANHDMTANGGVLPPTINESIRGQVALDWIGTNPAPIPSSTGAALMMAGM